MNRAVPPALVALVALVALGPGVAAVGHPTASPADASPVDAASAGQSADVTYVEGDVTENETWTAEDGPYRIATDVTVEEGATLRVAPGAAIQPAAGVSMTVQGNLSAEGTADDPITVATAPGAPDDVRWASIRYDGTADSRLSLEHVEIEDATNALTLAGSAGRVELSSVTVRNVDRNGIRVTDRIGTPRLTVEGSTFAGIGERAIAIAPGVGAIDEWRITANSTYPGERTEHQLAVTPGVDTTTDTIRVSYRGHGNVGEVDRAALREFGFDRNGNGSVGESLKPVVESVGSAGPNAYEIRLSRPVTVPADTPIRVAYRNVTNPRTYGAYPVDVSFRLNGVARTAATTLPFDLRSDEERPRADRYDDESRTGRVVVTGSTFEGLGEQGVFVAADAAGRFRIADNSFSDTGGPGIAVRGSDVKSGTVVGNRISGLGPSADGVLISAKSASDLTVRGNRIAGADAGVGLAARNGNLDDVRVDSNVLTGGTTGVRVQYGGAHYPRRVSLAVTDNEIADNARRGVSVDVDSARLRDVAVRGNEVRDNGGTGIHLDAPVLARAAVRDNAVEDNGGHGIRLDAAKLPNAAVRNNTVADNGGHGVSLESSLVVYDASVDGNRAFDNAGIGLDVDGHLTHAGGANLTRNLVAANGYGIRVAGALGTRVENNTVVYNADGSDAAGPTGEYRPGTGIVVEEGDAGAIFRTGDVSEDLAELLDDRQVETVVDPARSDEYTVVLRPEQDNYVWSNDAGALAVRSVSENVPTGVVLRKDDDAPSGVVVRHNDVYGHERGMTVNVGTLVDANTTARLLVDATRTVVAERNYWGASSGPVHDSIHPEGTGERITTRRGWVDFVPATASPLHPRHHRPAANVTVSPTPATVGDSVVVSGAESSDRDGSVAAYRFEITGPDGEVVEAESRSVADPNATVSFAEPGEYAVSLVVEDDVGVESDPATATVRVREEAETTATTAEAGESTETATETELPLANATTTVESNDQGGLLPDGGVPTTVGGLLGFALYGSALALGAYGAFRSFRRAGVPVRGTTINGLAAAGVAVWVGSGLLGADGLFELGVGAGALWLALVALLWLVARRLY